MVLETVTVMIAAVIATVTVYFDWITASANFFLFTSGHSGSAPEVTFEKCRSPPDARLPERNEKCVLEAGCVFRKRTPRSGGVAAGAAVANIACPKFPGLWIWLSSFGLTETLNHSVVYFLANARRCWAWWRMPQYIPLRIIATPADWLKRSKVSIRLRMVSIYFQ